MTERVDITKYRTSRLAVERAKQVGNTKALEAFALFRALAHNPNTEPFHTILEPGSGRRRPLLGHASLSLEAVLFFDESRGSTGENSVKIQLGYEEPDGGAHIQLHELAAPERIFDPYDEMVLDYFRQQYPDVARLYASKTAPAR